MLKSIVVCLVVVVAMPGIVIAQDEPEPRGVILVSSRKAGLETVPNLEGPASGDMGMVTLLQNGGYRAKLVSDSLLPDEIAMVIDAPTVEMIVVSGSSSSADVQPIIPGSPTVPVMMGEHVTLKDDTRAGYIPFYSPNDISADRNRWPDDLPNTTQFMKIVDNTHPITQGIQTDANGLVKIIRDPYPNEDAYSRPPTGTWRPNFEFGWPQEPIASKAPGLTVLAVSPLDETLSIFAVLDVGDVMANGSTATARYVHFFVNEQGSGGTRRRFNALNETGRLLFLRAAQWAMGDPLSQPGASEVENWNLF